MVGEQAGEEPVEILLLSFEVLVDQILLPQLVYEPLNGQALFQIEFSLVLMNVVVTEGALSALVVSIAAGVVPLCLVRCPLQLF